MTRIMQRGWRFLWLSPSAVGRSWGLTGSLIFEPRDLWVGVYWDNRPGAAEAPGAWELAVYVCLIPCLPIRLVFWLYDEEVPF